MYYTPVSYNRFRTRERRKRLVAKSMMRAVMIGIAYFMGAYFGL